METSKSVIGAEEFETLLDAAHDDCQVAYKALVAAEAAFMRAQQEFRTATMHLNAVRVLKKDPSIA